MTTELMNYNRTVTYSLIELDYLKRPIGFASGCIVSYFGHYFLLTVAHATSNNGNWAIELGYDTQKGAILFQLGGMSFLKRIIIKKGKMKHIELDFSYKYLVEPPSARFQFVDGLGKIVMDEPKVALISAFDSIPDVSEIYSFWGLSQGSFNGYELNRNEKDVSGLKYVGEENGLLFFKMKVPYRSYKEYQGCSGAPILDSRNRLIGLVVEGDKKRTGVYAVDLRKYKVVFDVELLQIQEPPIKE